MSAKRKPARERGGFEDIRSTSTGMQSRPEWFAEARPTATEAARQRQAERKAQRADPHARKKKKAKPAKASANTSTSSTRGNPRPGSSQRPRPQERGRPNERRQPAERPRKKPMSLLKRRVLIVLVLLMMLLGTGFLVESLLLRVTTVQISGDQVYAEEEILKICGFKTGDNLLLIPAADREKKLQRELPYIYRARITRKIPGTVNIDITAAKAVCCIQGGTERYVVGAGGKVLETGQSPKEGLMQVIGVSPKPGKTGEPLELENEAAAEVFAELAETMGKLSEDERNPAGEFTKMDLSDLYNIRLWYQDRVECRMGGAGQLEYKLRWAYGNLTNTEQGIKPEESGVLDLSYLPTKKRSYFTPSEGSAAAAPTPGPDGIVPEAPDPTPEPGRGGDIPNAPFTG